MNNRRGGFLDQIDQFDPAFFGIPEREAAQMDPQQRVVLEVAYEALDDAGITHERLGGSQTGVFFASFHNDYSRLVYAHPHSIDLRTLTGTLHSITSNRISYLLDLHGPSVTLDTACSSSLVAVHLACQSLRSREADICLAGGVNIVITPEMNVALSKVGFISSNGQCLTFDAGADGFVRGEGCGMIVLKRLSDALTDNDRVIAVIRGSAVNQDGRSTVLTAPNGRAQQEVVRRAIKNAALTPDKIGNVETHGTGTHLGDPIEVEALAQVMSSRSAGDPPCYLTAVKANIGHLEGAAGIAGVIKTALSLWKGQIPGHPTFTRLNPNITLEGTPFRIPTDTVDWKPGDFPRNAGVSSFGVGGTNAHIVLSEAPASNAPQPENAADRAVLLPISARTPRALVDYIRSYAAFLRSGEQSAPLEAVGATASLRRNHYDYRFAVAGATPEQIADRLSGFLQDPDRLEAEIARAPVEERPRIGFIFSGQGTQWPRMARNLIDQEPLFREMIETCDRLLQPLAGWSLLEKLSAGEEDATLDQTEVAQPAIFAVQVALDALWRSWGIVPDAVVGHSLGEIAAAYTSGALTLEEAIFLVYQRGVQMQQATGKGKMASLDLPSEEVRQLLLQGHPGVSIAAINSPRSTVISGPPEDMDAVIAELKARSISVRPLHVNYAFHSPQMEPYARALTGLITDISPGSTQTPMVSTVTGKEVRGDQLDAAYWGENIRRPVSFAQAVERLFEMGITVFVEISPHPALSAMVEQCASEKSLDIHAVPSLRRNLPERDLLLASAAKLYQFSADIHWQAFYPADQPPVTLPPYPWQRKRCWLPDTQAQAQVTQLPDDTHPLLGDLLRSPVIQGVLFQKHLQAHAVGYLADHQWMDHPVLPAAAMLEMAASGATAAFGAVHPILEEVMFHEALFLPAELSRALQMHFQKDTLEQAAFEVYAETADHEWVRYASGKVRLASSPPAMDKALNLDAIRQRCSTYIDHASLYQLDGSAEAGIVFGPAFQGVREGWRADGEALASVSLPEQYAPEKERYTIHPALLDALLQPLAMALPTSAADSAYLPWSVQRMTLLDRLPSQVWSHVRLEAGPSHSGETFSGHVEVFDLQGRCLLEISGIVLKRASSAALRRAEERGSRGELKDLFYNLDWERKPAAAEVQQEGRWLIFSDGESLEEGALGSNGIGADLSARLQQSDSESILVYPGERFKAVTDGQATVNPCQPEDFRQLMESLREEKPFSHILYLWGLQTPLLEDVFLPQMQQESLGGLLALVQAVHKVRPTQLPAIVIVTSGAQPAGRPVTHPEQSLVWGFANTLRLEHPELPCQCIDLDPRMALQEQTRAILQAVHEAAETGSDQRVAYTQNPAGNSVERLVERLDVLSPGVEAPRDTLRLEIQNLGNLDLLVLQPMQRRQLGPGEVEIEVMATGLNFRDVLKALGSYPGMAPGAQVLLGDECAGRISAVGQGVSTLSVGQPVIALASGALASYVTTPAALVVDKPAELTFEEAAALPITYLTAWYTLYHLARLQPGQRVLIHSAAGGVGLAAVQLARRVGAQIFATAGSPEKRAFLQSLGIAHVMDSRSLDFAGTIQRITDGAGVDVVLNALAGEFIPTSLSVLARGGCFLEIGRTNILSESQAREMRPDVRYYPVFLGDLYTTHPELVREMLSGILKAMLCGEIRALPRHTFAIHEAETAFRLMARARHVGKIVLTQPAPIADESHPVPL